MTNSEYFTLAQTNMYRKLINLEEENKKLRLENSLLHEHVFKLYNQLKNFARSFDGKIIIVKK